MGPGGASMIWFEIACQIAHIKARVVLESGAPHTLIELARSGYGIAVVPSTLRIPRKGVRTLPVVHRGASIGRWAVVAWHPERFLAPYADRFAKELVAAVRRNYPGCEFTRRAPALPWPKEPLD